MWNDIPILTVLFRLKAIGILNSIKILRGLTMNFNEMTIEQLKAYKASVEAYGTARELYEVGKRIKELLLNVRSK